MRHPFLKTSLLALAALIPLSLASCGPEYEDVEIAAGVYAVQDGKNSIKLTNIQLKTRFSCTVEMSVQEDQYYLWDIKEIARVTNFTTKMDYQVKVYDDVNLYPFPEYRDRKISFSSKATPFADGRVDDWAVSFRYQTHRFIFHLAYPSVI